MLFRDEDEDVEVLPFADRSEAGRVLAGKLSAYAGRDDVIVLGLPLDLDQILGRGFDVDAGIGQEENFSLSHYAPPNMARRFDLTPRVAMLSFSSFGSVDHPICTMELLRYADPMLIVDGEIAADDAVSPEIIEQQYPFSALKGGANVLIFPDLASANLATKLLAKIGGGEVIGPILMGMSRPVHVLQRTATVEEIVNVSAIAVVDAQENDTYTRPHVHVSVEPELVGED